MLASVKSVLSNALEKSPPFILSNSPSGIVVRLVQENHVRLKLVPADVSMSGKLVRPEQPRHAPVKLVPADVSMSGKLVRLEQPNQAP